MTRRNSGGSFSFGEEDGREALITGESASEECAEAVDAFYKHYIEHRAKEEPQPVHWTIAKLLKEGERRQQLKNKDVPQ